MTDQNGISEIRARGLKTMKTVYGWEMPSGDLGDFYTQTVEHLFGEIWNRPGLTIRDRRLLVLGALAAQGQFDLAKVQINAALQNEELTEEQMEEIVILLAHYVGYPLASGVNASRIAVVADRAKAARAAEKAAAKATENGSD
ncbi:carboxymuconolactone decarboxylase family protein [Rhodococcus sp. NPDC004095]